MPPACRADCPGRSEDRGGSNGAIIVGMDLCRIPVGCAVLMVPLAAACGSVGTGAPATTPTSRPVPAVVVHASEPEDATSVDVVVGARVTVLLHSTYWTIDSPSPPGVLGVTAGSVVTPELGGCVRGQGCGTVSMTFVAAGRGTTTVSAHRIVCGEALACAPAESTWRIVVRVP
jgi:hypothetical protein